jgi:hypothetical protein
MKISKYGANLRLLKSWFPEHGWGHDRENKFYVSIWEKKNFSGTSRRISFKLDLNRPCMTGIQFGLNKGPCPF